MDADAARRLNDRVEEFNFNVLIHAALDTSIKDWQEADALIVEVNLPWKIQKVMDVIEDSMRRKLGLGDMPGLRTQIETSFINNLIIKDSSLLSICLMKEASCLVTYRIMEYM